MQTDTEWMALVESERTVHNWTLSLSTLVFIQPIDAMIEKRSQCTHTQSPVLTL